MTCPNCGAANPDAAKFCSNCGTHFNTAPQPQIFQPPAYQAQSASSSAPPGPSSNANPLLKNVALGCLVALIIFFFLGLSCTRACFRSRRRYYRSYAVSLMPAARVTASVALK